MTISPGGPYLWADLISGLTLYPSWPYFNTNLVSRWHYLQNVLMYSYLKGDLRAEFISRLALYPRWPCLRADPILKLTLFSNLPYSNTDFSPSMALSFCRLMCQPDLLCASISMGSRKVNKIRTFFMRSRDIVPLMVRTAGNIFLLFIQIVFSSVHCLLPVEEKPCITYSMCIVQSVHIITVSVLARIDPALSHHGPDAWAIELRVITHRGFPEFS
jgi:hypothetical protein